MGWTQESERVDFATLLATPGLVYAVIAALVAFDAAVPAVPSEVAVVTAGTLAVAGDINLAWVLLSTIAGAVAGDYIVHTMGRRALPAILRRSRLGRRAQRNVEHAYARMGSASAGTIVAGRFIPLGRTASAAAAGLAGVSQPRFLAFSTLGATAWATWMLGIGYVTGTATEAPLWLQSALGACVALIVAVWIAAIRSVIRTRRRLTHRARLSAIAHAESAGTESPATESTGAGSRDIVTRPATAPGHQPTRQTSPDRSRDAPQRNRTAGRWSIGAPVPYRPAWTPGSDPLP
ncbi:DedA family protein [Actinobacteria bacterium YIM 96077]|uniref:VTT domain-containing protein n=1 Tax=Phytoactinopolyspora halophila TaxID=1981511 RepID=A0A329QZU4_9ACTN|nr:DedA family protein [Actinobacteria bacterium YIM 96077]RAW17845.1 hypothetical protein DPM12_03035 [Phytoactinopolyspora halophila]